VGSESFADKYAQVEGLVEPLNSEEREILVERIREMYETESRAALGFTLYGNLKELSDQVLKQLYEDNSNRAIVIHIIRKFDIKEAYENLEDLLQISNEDELEPNLVLTMFLLYQERAKEKLGNYFENAGTEDLTFILSNILYDSFVKKDKNKADKFIDLIKKRKDYQAILNISYSNVFEGIGSYGLT